MPLTIDDFDAAPGPVPERSAGFDAERPFLFEGLAPRFATHIVRSVFLPMRDGVRLSTDFHIPLGAALPLPVVLVRTPYNKNIPSTAMPHLLPEQGIVFAIQDVRGRYESEGEFIACSGIDRLDGEDTLTWLAAQPWCNGSIGTIGSSYTGETAAKTAAMCHPNHRCGVIMYDGSSATGNSRNGAYLQGGVTMLRMMFGWFRDYVPKVSYGPPPHIDREAWFSAPYAANYATQPIVQPPVDLDTHLRTLPVFDLLDRSGAAPSEFADMMRRSADPTDPYWQAQGFLHEGDRFHTPTIFVTGPLERGGSSFENFDLFRANAVSDMVRAHQYLWYTPAEHSGYAKCGADTHYGGRALADTRYDYYRKLVGWFAHWLRGDALDLDRWAKVDYFVLGANRWESAATWPPAGVTTRALYLHGGGRAATDADDGRLSFDRPLDEQPVDRFRYDPDKPTPSEPADTELDMLGSGYAERGSIERRDDVLTFTSAPFSEPSTLAGPVSLRLHVSSSAIDTDFAAVLSEVDAAGRSINITHGIARMRYRDGIDTPAMMIPGTVYAVTIDLWHVAIEIPVGHCLRLSISSSHFPAFDRNLNTGGDNHTGRDWIVADNAVHHDARHPSALLLPVRG